MVPVKVLIEMAQPCQTSASAHPITATARMHSFQNNYTVAKPGVRYSADHPLGPFYHSSSSSSYPPPSFRLKVFLAIVLQFLQLLTFGHSAQQVVIVVKGLETAYVGLSEYMSESLGSTFLMRLISNALRHRRGDRTARCRP